MNSVPADDPCATAPDLHAPAIRVGTRGSVLAMAQTSTVIAGLSAAGAGAIRPRVVTTPGDVNHDPVHRIGVGVFTQALREAMADGTVDCAVHSYKDLPSAADPRFHLVVPVRAPRHDALVARDGMGLADLPRGARVGTSAPRRVNQLRKLRPDLDVRPLRGNIDTRIGKVTGGELDAVVLAYAGLLRGGRAHTATHIFTPDELTPAPAQGALAVECRADDHVLTGVLDRLADQCATVETRAERAVLARLGAGCTSPVAACAFADTARGSLLLCAAVTGPDGAGEARVKLTGTTADPEGLAGLVAEELRAAGCGQWL
ncbi:hydroxymethylbilane synthase [Corynebacterium mendelii]|uniref:Hydroxymethylbilane synthase n=1 Tax=Corynebacterium mendelii TaxID=2765362 RepID=A0A939IWX1_9CORY|nr:hydroxymethylbilane synthase [Corynebacterium mendelii]MBN9643880.1 hydroxymethylbilane synthase [Corynebacterium mendelii]